MTTLVVDIDDRFDAIKKASLEQHILAPDEDFYRAITIDELLIGVKEDIREMFRKGKKYQQ